MKAFYLLLYIIMLIFGGLGAVGFALTQVGTVTDPFAGFMLTAVVFGAVFIIIPYAILTGKSKNQKFRD